MNRDHALAGILLLGLISGIFSPYKFIMLLAIRILAPGLLVSSPQIVAMLAMLIFSTLTIMAGGVAAAVFERATGRSETDATSYLIWFGATLLLTVPAIRIVMQVAF